MINTDLIGKLKKQISKRFYYEYIIAYLCSLQTPAEQAKVRMQMVLQAAGKENWWLYFLPKFA